MALKARYELSKLPRACTRLLHACSKHGYAGACEEPLC